MSRNTETVQRAYAAFGRGDVPGVLDVLSDDVEWEYGWGSEPLKWYVPRRGKAAVPGFFEAIADFEFERFEPMGFLEGGDMVAVPIDLRLRVKATGLIIRDIEMHLWTFDADGRVSRFRHIVDTRQFAEASAGT